jgi:molybdopterin molybdotransferase
MISVEDALKLIQENLPDFGDTCVTADTLLPGTLAEDIFSDRDYPPFDRVMMDGIAVNYNVWKEGKTSFRLEGIAPAGEPQKKLLNPDSALEVMTGAPLPENTTLVIPYEHITMTDGVAVIHVIQDRSPMENVHLSGSDTKCAERVLKSGEKLNGPAWGIAASVGKKNLRMKKNPSVLIISTGDELVDIEDSPLPHQIRRSNAYALRASLLQNDFSEVALSHLKDDELEIKKHLETHLGKFQLLIYSGGVSKGKFDYLPSVWKSLGVKEIFHGVSQRPGKPLWFGKHEKSGTVILGLPGNPVSSLVCLHRYLLSHKKIHTVLTEEIRFKNHLTYFVPAKLESSSDGRLLAHPMPIQNSGEFTGLAGSDGFIELARDKAVFSKGEVCLFHPWRKI